MSRTRFFALGVALLFVAPAYAADAAAPKPKLQETELIAAVEKKIGKIVAPEAMSGTYAAIQGIYDRLEPAYHRLTGSKQPGKILIIDSDVVNAMIGSPIQLSDGREGNVVLVTKGLLQRLAERLPPEKIPEAIAGVLGHEFGHPASEFSDYKFKDHYTRWEYNQAEEFKADLFAIDLFEKAGLPRDCLRTGLTAIMDGKDKGLGYSTHPESTLRMVVQELAVTSAQYSKGEVALVPLAPLKASALAEFQRPVSTAPKRKLIQVKADIVGLVEQVHSYWADKHRSYTEEPYARLDFTHLYITLLDRLKARGPNLPPDEEKAVLGLFKKMAESTKVYGVGFPRLAHRETDFDRGQVSFKEIGWPHDEADIQSKVSQTPFLHSERFKSWFRETFPSLLAFGNRSSIFGVDQISEAMQIAPIDVIIETHGDEAMRGYSGEGQGYFFVGADNRPEESRPELLLQAHRMRKFDILNEKSFLYDLDSSSIEGHKPKFFIEHTSFYAKPEEEDQQRLRWQSFLDEPRNSMVKGSLTELAKKMWDQRGKYGTLDLWLSQRKKQVDWNTLFHLIGIDPKHGYQELNRAIQEYARSPEYPKLLQSTHYQRHLDRLLPNRSKNARREDGVAYTQRPWLDTQTVDILLHQSADPDLKEIYYRAKIQVGERDLVETFRKELLRPGKSISKGKVNAALKAVEERLPFLKEGPFPGPTFRLIADAIDLAPIQVADKQLALRHLFLDLLPTTTGGYEPSSPTWMTTIGGAGFRSDASQAGWIQESFEGANEKTYRVLKKYGLVEEPSKLLATVYAPDRWKQPQKPVSNAVDSIGPMEGLLREELEQIGKLTLNERANSLQGYAERLFYLYERKEPIQLENGVGEQLLLRVLELGRTGLSPSERLKLFTTVLKAGKPRGSEAYVTENLAAYLKAAPFDPELRTQAQELLDKSLIPDPQLQIEVAEKILEPDTQALRSAGITQDRLKSYLDRVDQVVSKTSGTKEKLLEDLAWKLKLRQRVDLVAVEGRKALNWERIDPRIVHLISNFSSYFRSMNSPEMIDLITYFSESGRGGFPKSVRLVIENKARTLIRADGKRQEEAAEKSRRAHVESVIDQFRKLAQETTSVEKIPLFHWAMRMGAPPLAEQSDLVTFLARKYLRYEPNGNHERFLLAFLASVPESEHLASLSYLLSTANQTGGDPYLNIARAFGTPGIKAGQQISIWNLLGDEMSSRLENLKDKAGPMTLLEITDAVRAEYSPDIADRIVSVDKVLGSASLKTVSEATVRLPNGKTKSVVIMTQRPYSREKIAANLRRMKSLLVNLEKQNFNLNSVGLGKMLDAVERQLAAEIQMKTEAVAFRDAARFFEGWKGKTPKGWRFSVPKSIAGFDPKDTVLVMEKANGVPFKELPRGKEREAIGRAISQACVEGLFREGWFDPDRHMGNILVDPETKTIHMIDFGQATRFKTNPSPFRSDDRYKLAQLLRTINEGDAKGTTGFLERMAREQNPVERTRLQQKIQTMFENKRELSSRVTELVGLMSDHGMVLRDEFLSSGLKGLMTLASEKYVSPDEFKAIVKREAAAIILKKAPLAVWDEVSASCLLKVRSALQ